jgi:hypothetical protein
MTSSVSKAAIPNVIYRGREAPRVIMVLCSLKPGKIAVFEAFDGADSSGCA